MNQSLTSINRPFFTHEPFYSWVNQLFLWQFSSSQTLCLPGRSPFFKGHSLYGPSVSGHAMSRLLAALVLSPAAEGHELLGDGGMDRHAGLAVTVPPWCVFKGT